MATVCKVEKTRDYTVMSNFHLRDPRLSLKAKGLLSQMLSLPENWDYTLEGLTKINREGKDAIRAAVNELETYGYVRRRQTMDEKGHFAANEYIIYEQPQAEPNHQKVSESPDRKADKPAEIPQTEEKTPLLENPTTGNPTAEKPSSGNPTELNIEIQTPYDPPEGERPCPLQKIQDAYNKTCTGLRSITRITGSRHKATKARWRENPDLSLFQTLFDRAAASPFLNGRNKNGWRADFDWLMRPNNWAKVLEGKYDRETGVSNSDTGDWEEDDLLL